LRRWRDIRNVFRGAPARRKADGVMIRAYEHVGVKSTIRVTADQALAGELSPRDGCMLTRVGGRIVDASRQGEERILGYETIKIVSVTGNTRVTAWHAPALGCVPLKRILEEYGDSGDWSTISVLDTVAVRVGEPPASFLQSNGREMPPSAAVEEVERHRLRNAPVPPGKLEAILESARNSVRRQDENYERFKFDNDPYR
jgi:hypothetical protein